MAESKPSMFIKPDEKPKPSFIAANQIRQAKRKQELIDLDERITKHFDAIEPTIKQTCAGLTSFREIKKKTETYALRREKELSHIVVPQAVRIRDEDAAANQKRVEAQRRCLSFNPEDDDDDEDDENATASSSTNVEPDAQAKFESDDIDIKPDISDTKDDDTKPSVIDLDLDSDDDEDIKEMKPDIAKKKKPLGKDPTVDTSFLPDKVRDDAENKLREKLRKEFLKRVEMEKKQLLSIDYCYFDGKTFRQPQVTVTCGMTVGEFLQIALEQLQSLNRFSELKLVSIKDILLVKEGVIIPPSFPFHYFIATQSAGKDGPLYVWDAPKDAEREQRKRTGQPSDNHTKPWWPDNVHNAPTQIELHLARIVLKKWYEKNKHVPPAYVWQKFVPKKLYIPDADKRVGHGDYRSTEDEPTEEMSEQEAILRDFYVDCKYCLYKYDFHC